MTGSNLLFSDLKAYAGSKGCIVTRRTACGGSKILIKCHSVYTSYCHSAIAKTETEAIVSIYKGLEIHFPPVSLESTFSNLSISEEA